VAALPLVIAVSSYLASGRVGLGAIVPALQALGHDTIALPTVVLSNHAARDHVAGFRVDPGQMTAMAAAITANGAMDNVAAILTGYLPTRAHAMAARDLVRTLKAASPAVVYVCDPVLGDTPRGLYIEADAAAAVRDELVPLADAVTPNAFELDWLTGRSAATPMMALLAARALRRPLVFATSVAADEEHLATLLVSALEAVASVNRRAAHVPHGTGDLLAGLITGHLANGLHPRPALARACATLHGVITTSAGHCDLILSPAAPGWLGAGDAEAEIKDLRDPAE
jgi:pyridoxine kinase